MEETEEDKNTFKITKPKVWYLDFDKIDMLPTSEEKFTILFKFFKEIQFTINNKETAGKFKGFLVNEDGEDYVPVELG